MNGLIIKRPLAYFIDFLIMWCACVLPQLIAYKVFDGVPFKYFTQPFHIYLWVLCTVSLPIWLYFILQEMSSRQSTIGKRLMHLKVIGMLSITQSFTRTLVKLFPWEITHIGLVPIYFSTNPQVNLFLYLANGLIVIYIIYFIIKNGEVAIHDLLPGTKVVLD
ncbi:MAG: RDD family protein [Chitinophagaceae bacterium]|nr:RDD family protein [Chitinophagaceae bacterium]